MFLKPKLLQKAVRKDKRKKGYRVYSLFLCFCGKEFIARDENVASGNTKSCGCLKAQKDKTNRVTHGNSHKGKWSGAYSSWSNMIQRCTNPNNIRWENYGGRGIKVDPRWIKFENFLADMGNRPSGLSLDRVDNSLGYSRDNCRWATDSQQAKNRRPRAKTKQP